MILILLLLLLLLLILIFDFDFYSVTGHVCFQFPHHVSQGGPIVETPIHYIWLHEGVIVATYTYTKYRRIREAGKYIYRRVGGGERVS